MQILIAEDDFISRKLLTKVLTDLGHEVLAVDNGRDALDAFQKTPVRIIISDWMMPLMDGTTLCRAVRALPNQDYTYFLILTAKAGPDHYRQAMDAGVDDFLSKPLHPEELATRLRVAERIIRQRSETEEKIRVLARFPADNPNPVIQLDRSGKILYANAASTPLLHRWNTGPAQKAPPALCALVENVLESGDRQQVEITSGDNIYSFAATSVIEPGSTYVYGHDITDRKRAEIELLALKNEAVHKSLHDQLTGLPNRSLLENRLAHAVDTARQKGTKVALLLVDLDNFKDINDGYGHRLGDQALVRVGKCLCDNVRISDTVCRWGGDELVIILDGLTDRNVVPRLCEKLLAAVRHGVATSEIPAPVTLSLGFAVAPDDAQTPHLLLQYADHALYQAKEDGRDCWREFKGFPESQKARGCPDLFIRLSHAVQNRKISVHYQPMIDAVSQQVAGVEALARWSDPEYQWVPPDVFIPLAEEKGLILKLSEQVLLQGLADVGACRQRQQTLQLSINISKRQLLDPNYPKWLATTLEEHRWDPKAITLELTERQAIVGQSLGTQRLRELAALGFTLSIDDFGSGYSSFERLSEMPFHEIKICRSLTLKSDNPKGRHVLKGLVAMSQALGLRIVAEGVENEQQQAFLTEIGVHLLQGYRFLRPMPIEPFKAFLAGQTFQRAAETAPIKSF